MNFNQQEKELVGAWQLQLNHINGEKQKLELNSLTNLIEIKETKEFAGEVIYEKTINIDSNNYQKLDLGDVQGVSELTVNGKLIGTKWYGAHVYNIKDVLKKGKNNMSIKLITITGNYMKSLKDNPVAMGWTRHQDYYPMGIMGPVRMIK